MDMHEFVGALEAAARIGDRNLAIRESPRSGQVFVNFYNLPAHLGRGGGGGAEAENNRFMATVEGFGDPKLSRQGKGDGGEPVTGQVQVQTSIAFMDKERNIRKLRGKKGKPEAIAKYIAGFISELAKLEPNYTHTKVASPQDFQQEVRALQAYVAKGQPSRVVIASKLRELAMRVSAGPLDDLAPVRILDAADAKMLPVGSIVYSYLPGGKVGDQGLIVVRRGLLLPVPLLPEKASGTLLEGEPPLNFGKRFVLVEMGRLRIPVHKVAQRKLILWYRANVRGGRLKSNLTLEEDIAMQDLAGDLRAERTQQTLRQQSEDWILSQDDVIAARAIIKQDVEKLWSDVVEGRRGLTKGKASDMIDSAVGAGVLEPFMVDRFMREAAYWGL